jgi:hypothetical protein
MFSDDTIEGMRVHPSYQRLLDFAQRETSRSANPVMGPSDLAAALGESAQTIGNWQDRGVSKRGAQKAEALWGVSPTWVLEGIGQPKPEAAPNITAELTAAQVVLMALIGSSEDKRALLAQYDGIVAGMRHAQEAAGVGTPEPIAQALARWRARIAEPR